VSGCWLWRGRVWRVSISVVPGAFGSRLRRGVGRPARGSGGRDGRCGPAPDDSQTLAAEPPTRRRSGARLAPGPPRCGSSVSQPRSCELRRGRRPVAHGLRGGLPMRGACTMRSTRTERGRGPALQRLGRTNRIQPSARDVDDPSPVPCPDRPLLRPRRTSGFVPTILGPSGNAHCVFGLKGCSEGRWGQGRNEARRDERSRGGVMARTEGCGCGSRGEGVAAR